MDGDKVFEWIGIVCAYTFAVVVLLVSIVEWSAFGIVVSISYLCIYFWYFRVRKLVKPPFKRSERQKAFANCCGAWEVGNTPAYIAGFGIIVTTIIKLSTVGFVAFLAELEEGSTVGSFILLIPIFFVVESALSAVVLLALEDEELE